MNSLKHTSQDNRYLCFKLGQEHFALALLDVKEVIGMTKITPIPHTPDYFKGAINLRGQVISVIDLRTKLKIGKSEILPDTSIILIDFVDFSFGVIVDSVDSVMAIPKADISDPPHMDKGNCSDYITGVARHRETLTLILDLKRLITPQDQKAMAPKLDKVAI